MLPATLPLLRVLRGVIRLLLGMARRGVDVGSCSFSVRFFSMAPDDFLGVCGSSCRLGVFGTANDAAAVDISFCVFVGLVAQTLALLRDEGVLGTAPCILPPIMLALRGDVALEDTSSCRL